MKTPFKISFEKTESYKDPEKLLNNFKNNFEKSLCDHVYITNDRKLFVKNDYLRWPSDMSFNLWLGITDAVLSVQQKADKKSKQITYTINFTKYVVAFLILYISIPSLLIVKYLKDNYFLFWYCIIVTTCATLFLGLLIYRHWRVFTRTLKYGADYLNIYDWDNILKQKSDAELIEIKNGNRILPKSVVQMAISELIKRKEAKNS